MIKEIYERENAIRMLDIANTQDSIASLQTKEISVYEGDPERDRAIGKEPLFKYSVNIVDIQPGLIIEDITISYKKMDAKELI